MRIGDHPFKHGEQVPEHPAGRLIRDAAAVVGQFDQAAGPAEAREHEGNAGDPPEPGPSPGDPVALAQPTERLLRPGILEDHEGLEQGRTRRHLAPSPHLRERCMLMGPHFQPLRTESLQPRQQGRRGSHAGRTGTVLMSRPTMDSAPGTDDHLQARVAAKTTSSVPV